MKRRGFLGHQADAASGSDAVYGRELQSGSIFLYLKLLRLASFGRTAPEAATFAPGWSREAMLKATAAAPAATVQSTDTAEDEDEASAVVSDDSDSDADDTDMPLYWAHPTSQILHRTTFGSAMFLCGRAFGDHYRRIPIARAQTYPLCSKCFAKGSFE